MENRGNISNPCRWYSDQELSALSDETWRNILNHPDQATAIAARKRAKRNTSDVSTNVTNANNDNSSAALTTCTEREIFQAATINSIMNSMNHNNNCVNTLVQYPAHGN